jgi:hypothetical protein
VGHYLLRALSETSDFGEAEVALVWTWGELRRKDSVSALWGVALVQEYRMAKFKTGYEHPQELLQGIKENNNISFLGGDRYPLVQQAYDEIVLATIAERRLQDRVSELDFVGTEMWSAALEGAQKFFSEFIEKNKHVIPEHIRELVIMEPRVNTNALNIAYATDIGIGVNRTPFQNEWNAIQERIEQRTGQQLAALRTLRADHPKKSELEQSINEKAADDLYQYRKLYLTSILIHEMVHLLGRKVLGPTNPSALRVGAAADANNPADDGDLAPVAALNGQRARVYIQGNNVNTRKSTTPFGRLFSELATSLSEVSWWKSNKFSVVSQRLFKIDIEQAVKPKFPDLFADIKSILRDSGAMNRDTNECSIPVLGLEGMSGLQVNLSYKSILRAMLDLGCEIFMDEVISSRDPYKVLLERSLISSCLGKPSRFFSGATFKGLNTLPVEEQKAEFRGYKNFFISLGPTPDAPEMVLIRAFISAGISLSDADAIAVRRQIVDIRRKMA